MIIDSQIMFYKDDTYKLYGYFTCAAHCCEYKAYFDLKSILFCLDLVILNDHIEKYIQF